MCTWFIFLKFNTACKCEQIFHLIGWWVLDMRLRTDLPYWQLSFRSLRLYDLTILVLKYVQNFTKIYKTLSRCTDAPMRPLHALHSLFSLHPPPPPPPPLFSLHPPGKNPVWNQAPRPSMCLNDVTMVTATMVMATMVMARRFTQYYDWAPSIF